MIIGILRALTLGADKEPGRNRSILFWCNVCFFRIKLGDSVFYRAKKLFLEKVHQNKNFRQANCSDFWQITVIALKMISSGLQMD